MIAALALAVVAVVLVVHEAGHAAAAIVLGIPARPIVTRHGVGMAIGSDDRRLTRSEICITASAGPIANVAFAAVAAAAGVGLLVLPSILFGLFCLIPVPRSDGHRLLHGYGDQR